MAVSLKVIQGGLAAHLDQWDKERGFSIPNESYKRDYCWASGFTACARKLALDLIDPRTVALSFRRDPDSLARRKRGEDRERDIVLDLTRAGQRADPQFSVTGQQERYELLDRDGTLLAVLRIDGMIAGEPFDVKAGETFRYCRSIEDLDGGKYTTGTVNQMLLYLLGTGRPRGWLIIDQPGVPYMLPVILEEHLARAERLLQEARHAVDARFGRRELPDFTTRRELCTICPHYGATCAPDSAGGEGVRIITDESTVQALDDYVNFKDDRDRYERAKKLLSKELRGVEQALVGDYHVQPRYRATTKYPAPDAIKKVIHEMKEPFKQTDPAGALVGFAVTRFNHEEARDGSNEQTDSAGATGGAVIA